ncbi:MAG: MBL fold metallo-hydrolase, partial [Ardenticatenaceae bacterium]|nr:MBL fold metallo-hydrolase [Ardenticatenaceae bacterium]
TEENLPAGQLAKVGLTPADIDVLVMTHSDIDHVGGIHAFPQATMVIHADERAYEKPRYWNGRSPLTWPNNKTKLIHQDTELCSGLTLLSTPGHAPGHLSLLLHLPQTGYVLLIGDAIARPSELQEGFGGAWNHDLARASADKLMDIAQDHNALIIYGHDPEQWPTLKKAPEFYGE